MTSSERSGTDVTREVEAYWDDRAETFDDGSQQGIHSEDQREAW